MSNIDFPDATKRSLLPPLPPLPDWFNAHPQAPAHTDACELCKRNAASTRPVDYSAYLKTPEWQIRRQLALEFYGATCCLCNSPDHLNVHHRTYERIGQEHLRDLIVLCRPCHERYHRVAA